MVVELPAGPLMCTANDLNQRWVLDMGLPGPDEGRGAVVGRSDQARRRRLHPKLFWSITVYDAEPLRDVQEAASHADPRTTMRHDRRSQSLDRRAADVVAALIAGASR